MRDRGQGKLIGATASPWIWGAMGSCVFIWIVSAVFSDSTEAYWYYTETSSWGIQKGTTVVHRSEGNGVSYFGELGIGAIEDVRQELRPVVLLWGDSYVEALQVDDSRKMAQQLTALFQEHGYDRICAGRGMSGDNIADYILNIPEYDREIPNVDCHIVLLASATDILWRAPQNLTHLL